MVQVKQVAVLAPLKKCPELCPKQFLRRKRGDLSSALMPVTLNRKGHVRQTVEVGVFARVDFDLEIENLTGIDFRGEFEYQVHRVPGLLALGLSEPREGITDRIDRFPNRLSLRLNEVDVFGVAQRLLEEKLVDRRATTKGNLAL